MKSLNQYIIEKILINKSSKFNKIKVETRKQLETIILERYNKNKSFIDLTDIDISELDDLSYIFYELYSMEVVDISGWDTSNVINMSYMFNRCTKLKKIVGIENLDVSKLKTTKIMFYGCKNLVELDLTNWNTISLENMSYMFCNCTKLDVDLSNWDLTNIKDHLKAGIIDDSGITETHYPKI